MVSFKEGQKVYAKYEGSGGNWFPAEVVWGPDSRGYYEVKFENDQYDHLKASCIARESAMRSGSKSPSRKKSPARARSRSRSRSRGRSPGRGRARSKSPAPRKSERKEPTKKEKSPPKKEEATPPRPSRRTRAAVEEPAKPNHETPTRHSARIAAIQNEKPVVEHERLETRSRVSKTRQLAMGGAVGAFLCALTSPIFFMLLTRHCTKKDCTFLKLPTIPRTLSTYFDRQSTYLHLGLSVVCTLLYLLPVGRLVSGPTQRNGRKLKYRLNGLAMFVIVLAAILVSAFYFKLPVQYIYEHTFHLLVLHILSTFVLSTILYVKARRAGNGGLNPNANSGNVIYDWFLGHELNPRVGPIDFKFLVLGRGPLLMLVVYNASVLAKACVTAKAAPSNTLLVLVGMQLLYCLDGLWHEEEVLYRWDMRHEGLGQLMLQTYVVSRHVLMTMPVRFVFGQGVQHSNWVLAAIFFVFAAGYVVYRGSTTQKFLFRKNPYDPSLAHFESIPTSTGKRLLKSGWWGLVRHPNYLGEVIMTAAFCLVCGFTHFYPYIYLLYVLAVLVGRAVRDDRHMRKTYSGAYTNYCQAVSHRLVPFVW